MLKEHKQQTNKTHPKNPNKKKPTVFALYFPLFQSPLAAHQLFGYIKAILEQSEFRASQHNSRNSHILLCGTKTLKSHHCASQHPLGQSGCSAGSHHMQTENNALFSMFSRHIVFTFSAREWKLQ